jgi:hypothetical protein
LQERIVAVFEEILDNGAVALTDNLYTVDVTDWKASRLFRAFFRPGAKPMPFHLVRDTDVTLKIDGLPFFKALDTLLKETGCYLWGADQSIGPRVRSLPEAFVKKYAPIVAYDQDARFLVRGVAVRKTFYPPGPGSQGLALSGWLLTVPGLAVEPLRRFGGAAEVTFEAADDTGRDLSGTLAFIRRRSPGSFFVQLLLAEPAPEAKTITNLTLTVKTHVLGRAEELTLDDLRGCVDADTADLEGLVQVKVVDVSENRLIFTVSGKGNTRLGAMGTITASGGYPQELRVTGPDGTIIPAASYLLRTDGNTVTYEISFDSPLPKTLRLSYYARGERRPESFSFTFADIPLFGTQTEGK